MINGKPAKKPSVPVNEGDEAEVTLPDAVKYCAKPEDIPVEIVYEDGDIAVVNKPQGMTVHMGNGNFEGTLVNALLYKLLSLSKQIEEKTCKRTYLALLEGNLKDDSGTITTYIGRDPKDRVKMAVVPPEKGKIAITDFTVLKRFKEGYTLCRFDLKTGRTHQIRVHAKYLAHPVVGDPVYGVKKQKFNLNGQLLHAWRLRLVHPKTGEEMTFEAPMPDYFTKVLKKLNEI